MNKVVSIKEFKETDKGTFTIELSRYIEASPETVWEILSNKATLAEFMECEIEGELEVGAPIKFIWREFEGDKENCSGINGGTIINMIPNTLLSFTWGDENPSRDLPWGSTLVEFKIEEKSGGCLVTIFHYDLPTEKEAEEHTGGWTMFLEKNTVNWT
ncbi:MAG: SRPBCC domain-containing protein [Emcibacteraceae bacterium]|nr:SRPBCC domain-containing protein [Emcibacteraceae bacterium]